MKDLERGCSKSVFTDGAMIINIRSGRSESDSPDTGGNVEQWSRTWQTGWMTESCRSFIVGGPVLGMTSWHILLQTNWRSEIVKISWGNWKTTLNPLKTILKTRGRASLIMKVEITNSVNGNIFRFSNFNHIFLVKALKQLMSVTEDLKVVDWYQTFFFQLIYDEQWRFQKLSTKTKRKVLMKDGVSSRRPNSWWKRICTHTTILWR